MNIGIVFAKASKQIWMKLDVPEGCTVQNAVKRSGILQQFPEIDLDKHKIGIFGRVTKLDTILEEGQRVEIYRPITADPETAERRD